MTIVVADAALNSVACAAILMNAPRTRTGFFVMDYLGTGILICA
jgi:hypothetical protein